MKWLGVTLDKRLSFDAHVNAVAKACNYHFWGLRYIPHLLTTELARTLARSIIGAHLDYYNSTLYGASDKSVNILQGVQNMLVRVVLQQPKFSNARPLLKSLQWLPIRQRIYYKTIVKKTY
jgi:hypothetical protein